MTGDVAKGAFRFSRIYAQGWNAAHGAQTTQPANPYTTEPERTRWNTGFTQARNGRQGS